MEMRARRESGERRAPLHQTLRCLTRHDVSVLRKFLLSINRFRFRFASAAATDPRPISSLIAWHKLSLANSFDSPGSIKHAASNQPVSLVAHYLP